MLFRSDFDNEWIKHYIDICDRKLMNQNTLAELTVIAMKVPKRMDLTSLPQPVEGDPEKVAETMQYVYDKLHVQDRYWPVEIGLIGSSDLWLFRKGVRNGVGMMFEAEMFLLRDLDPTSGQVITKTDERTGNETFSVNFKFTNNSNRGFYVSVYSSPASKQAVTAVELVAPVWRVLVPVAPSASSARPAEQFARRCSRVIFGS